MLNLFRYFTVYTVALLIHTSIASAGSIDLGDGEPGAQVYSNVAAFPAITTNGRLAIDGSTDSLYIYNGAAWVILGSPSILVGIGALDGQAASANGASSAGNNIYMQSATAAFAGLVNTGVQSFAGAKTFTGAISASNLSGTNTGDLSLAAVGAVPNNNGASLVGQVLNLQPADSTHPGVITGAIAPLKITAAGAIDANYNAANSILKLDAGGKILTSQLPNSVMEFLGQWDASTNTPALADGVGNAGDVYRVNVAGTQNLGSGNITFAIADWVMYDGAVWQLAHAGADIVQSVNGATGVVTVNAINQLTGDVTAGPAAGSQSQVATIANLAVTNAKIANATIDLTAKVMGVLPIANGGTNSSTALNNNRVMQSSGGAIVEASAITASRALISDVNGIPTHSAVTSAQLAFVANDTALTRDLYVKKSIGVDSATCGAELNPCSTIQQALTNIGDAASAADVKRPASVTIEGGNYDESLTIPRGRAITLIGRGTVVLGDGAGANWASTVSRSITVTFDNADVFGSDVKPALNIVTLPNADQTSTFLAEAGGFYISGALNIAGNGLSHTINLNNVKLFGTITKTATGLTNFQAYNSYFIGAINMATSTILERVYNCQFDALITVDSFNSIFNSEIKAGMTVATISNTLPPSGMFFTTFTGTFTGPANSFKVDLTTDYFFRANGASLAGGATEVLQGTLATTSITGLLSSTDWNTFNGKQAKKMSVVDGGNAAYSIAATDDHIRSGTTLTANRTYTLPACAAGNIGEHHEVKNAPAQTFNIILAAFAGDFIDGQASFTLNPGDSMPVVCGVSGTWDIE